MRSAAIAAEGVVGNWGTTTREEKSNQTNHHATKKSLGKHFLWKSSTQYYMAHQEALLFLPKTNTLALFSVLSPRKKQTYTSLFTTHLIGQPLYYKEQTML